MQIILEPTVTVIGQSKFIPHPDYLIPDDGDDATKIGSFAAKGCYDSYGVGGRSNEDNQRAVIESIHGSVLEHSTVSMFFTGISRGLSLELNRHRPFAISQRSTRYTKEEDASIVLEPYYAELFNKGNWRYAPVEGMWIGDGMEGGMTDRYTIDNDENRLLFEFLNESDRAIRTYQKQVEYLINLNPMKLEGFDLRKWARGKARNILPHALETRGTWTNNHRGWRWFVEVRSAAGAEPEVRRLAHHCLLMLRKTTPLYYEDFEIDEIYDGIPVWKPKYTKV